MTSAIGFVLFVYTSAILYAGFKLGATYNTVPNLVSTAREWIAGLAKGKGDSK